MKKFMIIYADLKHGKTLEELTSAKNILGALLEARGLCRKFSMSGVPLEVVSITEIVNNNGSSGIYSI